MVNKKFTGVIDQLLDTQLSEMNFDFNVNLLQSTVNSIKKSSANEENLGNGVSNDEYAGMPKLQPQKPIKQELSIIVSNDSGFESPAKKKQYTPEKELFHCPECKIYYRDNHNLRRHKLYKHEHPELSKCPKCNLSLSHLESLLRHLQNTHKIKDLTKYKCIFCTKGLATEALRDYHQSKCGHRKYGKSDH